MGFRTDGKVIAKMNLVLDKAMYEKGRALKEDPRTVRKAIEDTVAAGRVGALTLDPSFLVFEPMSRKSSRKKKVKIITNMYCISVSTSEPVVEASSFWLSMTKLYVVIGCIVALVVIAIIQAGCTIYKTSRGSSVNHKVPICLISLVLNL